MKRQVARARVIGLLALVIALLAAGRLLTLPHAQGQPSRQTAAYAEVSLRDVWPRARVVQYPGQLVDGRAFTARFHIDVDTSVGTALTADGTAVRLVVRSGNGDVRELMRHPATVNPRFNSFVVAGDDLFWMLSEETEVPRAVLYRASLRDGGAATQLTTDTGNVIFFNWQYDLVVADGFVHWTASRTDEQVTELRSVPIRGGQQRIRRVDGDYALTAWPWLVSAGGGQSGAVELRNIDTDQRITVPGDANELITCNPVWCRVLLFGSAGQAARTDLMHPDGSGRLRVAGRGVVSAVLDVALMDRFEVLSIGGPPVTGVTTRLKILLFDAAADRSVVLATDVTTIQARGSVVWWSTGENETLTWYALDLRTLT